LATKKIRNPFLIFKFVLQLVLFALFSFISVLFITKFGI
jgi:hypothetical protein